MTAKIINIKDLISKKKIEEFIADDNLTIPFFDFYKTDEQLDALLEDISNGVAANARAQDMAMSVVSCIAEKLRAMEALFFKVQPDDVEHEDLLNVMEMGHSSHQYLNMFLAKFLHYPACIDLLRTAKNSVIYQELYTSRAINDLLEKRFNSKPVIKIL